MGRLITAPEAVKAEIDTPKGTATYEQDFWGFLIIAVNAKAPVQDLGAILEGKEVREILKVAKEAKAVSITVEDAQHKIMHACLKSYVPTLIPVIAMEVIDFIKAMEDKTEKNPGGVEKVDLTAKK